MRLRKRLRGMRGMSNSLSHSCLLIQIQVLFVLSFKMTSYMHAIEYG